MRIWKWTYLKGLKMIELIPQVNHVRHKEAISIQQNDLFIDIGDRK